MTARLLVKKMKSLGCAELRQRGSHIIMRHPDGCQTVVAMHSGDMPVGTLRAIERHMEPCLGKGWLRR
jgi:predicted RNA binding protein YcfA (HicA-like mRNA interferase family)